MRYTQIQPPPYLKNCVQHFWTLEGDCAGPEPGVLGPLADGCPGIIFQQPESGVYLDHLNKQLPGFFLYGQTVTRTSLNLAGSFQTVGVCFFPNMLKHIFGFNAYELTDSCLDLSLPAKRKEGDIAEMMLNATTTEDRIGILSAYLFSQISKKNKQVDDITGYAVAQIVQSKGNVSLPALQGALKLSERSFQRRFRQEVGISPKLFAKVCRFQASLVQLRKNDYTRLSDVAFDNGYTDQSHFIRNFKEFAGFSPHQFQQQGVESPGSFLY